MCLIWFCNVSVINMLPSLFLLPFPLITLDKSWYLVLSGFVSFCRTQRIFFRNSRERVKSADEANIEEGDVTEGAEEEEAEEEEEDDVELARVRRRRRKLSSDDSNDSDDEDEEEVDEDEDEDEDEDDEDEEAEAGKGGEAASDDYNVKQEEASDGGQIGEVGYPCYTRIELKLGTDHFNEQGATKVYRILRSFAESSALLRLFFPATWQLEIYSISAWIECDLVFVLVLLRVYVQGLGHPFRQYHSVNLIVPVLR